MGNVWLLPSRFRLALVLAPIHHDEKLSSVVLRIYMSIYLQIVQDCHAKEAGRPGYVKWWLPFSYRPDDGLIECQHSLAVGLYHYAIG